METVSWIAGILSVIIAWVTFKKTFSSDEEFEHLVAQFRAAQKLSIETRSVIEEYSNKHDCWDDFIFSNVSYRAYFKALVDGYETYLSDSILEKVVKSRPSKSILRSMISSLEKQAEALTSVKLQVQVFLDTH